MKPYFLAETNFDDKISEDHDIYKVSRPEKVSCSTVNLLYPNVISYVIYTTRGTLVSKCHRIDHLQYTRYSFCIQISSYVIFITHGTFVIVKIICTADGIPFVSMCNHIRHLYYTQ